MRVVHRVAGEIDAAGADLELRLDAPASRFERRLDELFAGLDFVSGHVRLREESISYATTHPARAF
jgi:hypothetical protein